MKRIGRHFPPPFTGEVVSEFFTSEAERASTERAPTTASRSPSP